MRVAICGGILHHSSARRRRVQPTTETILVEGLSSAGIDVLELSPRALGRGVAAAFRGVDLVHIHHPGRLTSVLGFLPARAPLIYTPHRMYDPDRALLAVGHRRMKQAARYVVALSPAEVEHLRARGWTADSIALIPNGLPGVGLRPCTRVAPSVEGSLRILFVGQLVPVKQPQMILYALAASRLRPQIALTMVFQNDSMLCQLRNLASALGIASQVNWKGKLTGKALADEYYRAHALVLSSRSEALPSVITEAMFTGLPVIAPDVGGIRWQLNGWGVCLHHTTTHSLALAFQEVFTCDWYGFESAKVVAGSARDRFSPALMVERHLELYKRVAHEQ